MKRLIPIILTAVLTLSSCDFASAPIELDMTESEFIVFESEIAANPEIEETTVTETVAESETNAAETEVESSETEAADELSTVLSANIGEIIQFGGYDWRVLDIQDGRALIISEYILEKNLKYHGTEEDATWENCDLRAYLNGEFLGGFSESDRARIIQTTNKNPDNPWYITSNIWEPPIGGGDTDDYIFLLSLDEVVKYFGDSGDLANRRGWRYDGYGEYVQEYVPEERTADWEWELKDWIDDEYSENRIAYLIGTDKSYWWWLRSPGYFGGSAAYVVYDGRVSVAGISVVHSDYGIRPAMWIKID